VGVSFVGTQKDTYPRTHCSGPRSVLRTFLSPRGTSLAPTLMPAIASPLPFSAPRLFLIVLRATQPKTIPSTEPMPQTAIETTNEAIAKPLVLGLGGNPAKPG
jgi:hypothetical protein